MSADRFVDELKASKKIEKYRVEVAQARVNGHHVRPESQWGTAMHSFGRGSVLIQDKAALKAERKAQKEAEKAAMEQLAEKVEVEENDWVFQVPNQTRTWT